MKLLVVHDEVDKAHKDLAYVFYHEKSKRFYIELEENTDLLPASMAVLVEQGQLTLNSVKARQWVEERLAAIGLQKASDGADIDEFQLLKLTKGRCSEDSYKLCQGCEHRIAKTVLARQANLIEDVAPLDNYQLLVFFKSGATRKIALEELVKSYGELASILENEELFRQVEVLAEGFALGWDSFELTYAELLDKGVAIPLTRQDFVSFVDYRVYSTCQATELLGCTRQNINYLVDREKLVPINKDKRTRLFLKQELLENI